MTLQELKASVGLYLIKWARSKGEVVLLQNVDGEEDATFATVTYEILFGERRGQRMTAEVDFEAMNPVVYATEDRAMQALEELMRNGKG